MCCNVLFLGEMELLGVRHEAPTPLTLASGQRRLGDVADAASEHRAGGRAARHIEKLRLPFSRPLEELLKLRL